MLKFMFPFLEELGGTPESVPDGSEVGGLGFLNPILMIALFGLLMYFMLYRPQKKQEKAVNEMRSSLKVGDEISTNGGILGKIIQIKDDYLVIETGNDRTKLKITKWAVRSVEHREEEDEDEEDDED